MIQIRRNYFLFSVLASLLTVFSCKKHAPIEDSIDMGYEYYPLTMGDWAIYETDSIYYDTDAGIHDTASCQLKEYLSETFLDNEGRESFKIERYKRDNDSAQWAISDIWYVTPTSGRIERIEEDIRYEPFIFPVKNNTRWDLNTFNSYNIYNLWEDDDSKIEIEVKDTLVHAPYTIDSIAYDSTVTVWHKYETLINYEVYNAVYAKNIGLLYKEMTYYYSKQITAEPITERVSKGVKYTQKLISYGNDQ